jgi:metallophosphoesterase (TIGR03767 family)
LDTKGNSRSPRQAALALASLACSLVVATIVVGAANAGDAGSDTLGHTTVEQRLAGDGDPDFEYLSVDPSAGEGYVVREEGIGTAQGDRALRRESLLYFGQLSDFQLADEESPARVEFLDFGPFSSATRQNEGMLAHQADAMIRQLNAFAGASPLAAGDDSHRAMDFTINTGDAADSQQRNETLWVRTLAEGGTLTPGSGINPANSGDPLCIAAGALGLVADGTAPQNYTGVQDYDDYNEGAAQFYDPDQPLAAFAAWPSYPGLMNAGQASFEAEGLDVPHYLTFGNHDALVQGNAFANAAYEKVATGCVKAMAPLTADVDTLGEALESVAGLNLAAVLNLLMSDPTKIGLVPPDPARNFVSKLQYKNIFRAGTQADGHGFEFVEVAEEAASEGAAGYYSWNPEPGIRFISLDTVSEAGVVGPSADGNIDDPQFQWLEGELEEAEAADELVVLFSHHAIPSLTASVFDEMAGPCTVNDAHGHGVNPGCDLDPRDSQPIHLGDDLETLLHANPNVIAWVAGHSHQNDVDAYPNPSGTGGFWSIRVAAEADWPQQSRLLEIFDNDDGTLSIFGTILDLAAPATSVAPGTDASTLGADDLASLGRTIGFNETQYGAATCSPICEGQPVDRNVELLVADPRDGGGPGPGPDPSGRCQTRIEGTRGNDRLVGTSASERIRGRRGKDRIVGRGGRDCLRGGRGKDRIRGGAGNDRIGGAARNDRIVGGPGRDRLSGGRKNDRINAMDGERDVVLCGKGNDFVRSDFEDVLRRCERGVAGGERI